MTPSPQPESPEPLKVVAHMRADGSAWNGYASCRPGDVEAFAVTRLSDAEAAIQAARNEAEAMRAFASFFRDRGEELFCHFGMEAIDLYNAAMKGDAHA